MKSPSCSHHDLPTDVLHSIQKHLPLDDYFRFAAVCNSWRFAAKQNPYLSKPDEIPWLFLFHYPDDYDFANAIRFSLQNNSRCKMYEIPVPKSFRGYQIISSVGRHLILRKMHDKSSGFFLVNPFNWTQIGCLPSAISFSCPLHLITPFPHRRPIKIVTDGSTAVALFPFTPAYTTLGSDTWIGLHETLTNSMDFLDVIAVCGKPGVFYIAKTASFCDVVVGALHFDFSSSHRNVVSWVDMTLNLRKDYISKEDTSLVTEEGSLKELEIFVDVRLVISSSNLFLVRWRLILTKDEMKRREVVVYKLLDDDTNQRKRWVLAETLGTCSFFIGHNQTISLSSPKLRSNCIYFSYYPYLPAKNDYWPDHGSDFEHCWIYNLGDGSWEQLYDVDDQFYSYMMYASAGRTVWITPCLGILTTLSQTNGRYRYDYATIPFLAEIFKLLVSSFFLWKECKGSSPPRMTTEWQSVRLFPIPSIIYLVHNNVQFATLTYVDPSTYQIMGNLKIVTTGILFRLFLRRKLSNIQWMAIVLLAVGTTTSQVKGCGETSCDSLFSAPIQGYMLGLLSACLSALAGVYTEYLMKKNNDSLYWQNVQLYTFGAIFNLIRLLCDDFQVGFEKGPWWERIFNGYSITTWLVVLNLGSTGLLVSWLMKYADNIVKVYSTSMAMLLTMIVSVFLFSFKPTIQLFLGTVICMISLHMYFAPVHVLVDLPLTSKAALGSLSEISVDRQVES